MKDILISTAIILFIGLAGSALYQAVAAVIHAAAVAHQPSAAPV